MVVCKVLTSCFFTSSSVVPDAKVFSDLFHSSGVAANAAAAAAGKTGKIIKIKSTDIQSSFKCTIPTLACITCTHKRR